jgi:hypothetical protein
MSETVEDTPMVKSSLGYIDCNVGWYKLDLIRDFYTSDKSIDDKETGETDKRSHNDILGVVLGLTEKISTMSRDIVKLREEIDIANRLNSSLQNEVLECNKKIAENRREILELHDITQRERNMYVRTGIPFKFTPDSNSYSRLFRPATCNRKPTPLSCEIKLD